MKVYTPEEYINKRGKYDFIICASVDEQEMRKTLEQLQVPKSRIVSGRPELENLLQYPEIYDVSRIIAFQNQEILASIKRIEARNRFWDMSSGFTYMKNISLTPGGWAVTYDYMYVMLRVLESKKPKSILEMGLGQSSKILARYQKDTGCHYDIVEQDYNWYEFFKEQLEADDKVSIHLKPLEQRCYPLYEADVYCYMDFESIVIGKTFDFISIDGPWGSEGISRIDILPYLPQCLKQSFVIMLDDYERDGEKAMIVELEKILKQNEIKYHKAVYGNEKHFCLITSKDNSFLCNLY